MANRLNSEWADNPREFKLMEEINRLDRKVVTLNLIRIAVGTIACMLILMQMWALRGMV